MLIRFAPPSSLRGPARLPRTIVQFQAPSPDEDACRAFLVQCRWSGGYGCPRCGGASAALLGARRLWQCTA